MANEQSIEELARVSQLECEGEEVALEHIEALEEEGAFFSEAAKEAFIKVIRQYHVDDNLVCDANEILKNNNEVLEGRINRLAKLNDDVYFELMKLARRWFGVRKAVQRLFMMVFNRREGGAK